ncbi:MAG: hypothetical protein RLZ28_890, partial [Actinomycetota bacterium]
WMSFNWLSGLWSTNCDEYYKKLEHLVKREKSVLKSEQL